MLGGPNGAGKTTAAQVLVPKSYGVREFVNADEIARGLSPFNPDGVALAAGRLMLRRIDELVFHGESFAFETTCAGRGHALWLKRARAEGWRVSLLYLWLDSPDLARARVSQRCRKAATTFHPM
jgi:predicted ABC-type ATPase